jgi:hypothetical protein
MGREKKDKLCRKYILCLEKVFSLISARTARKAKASGPNNHVCQQKVFYVSWLQPVMCTAVLLITQVTSKTVLVEFQSCTCLPGKGEETKLPSLLNMPIWGLGM